jgi:hypothetical protein
MKSKKPEIFNSRKPPVLITGAHRSGKSYTVRGININNEFNIIHEPLNINSRIGWTGIKIPNYFLYIDHNNSRLFKPEFERMLYKYEYRLTKQLKEMTGLKDLTQVIKDLIVSLKYRANNNRTLIDDPFAVFSAEWFHKEFGSDVIIMVRHPASFAGSLKLLNYRFPFSHILNQENLIEGKLSSYRSEITEFASGNKSVVEQGVLLWRVIYDIVNQYRNKYGSKWLFLRFEDIVRIPESSFNNIYKYLGLSLCPTDLQKINSRLFGTGQTQDKEARLMIDKNIPGYVYSIEDHLGSYKNVLSETEILYVKERSKDVWNNFYTDEDWL